MDYSIECFLLKKVSHCISDERFINDPMGKQRWQGLVKYLNQEDWSNKIPTLLDYLNVCDDTRGLNFKETFPELTL